MGQIWKPNKALLVKQMVNLVQKAGRRYHESKDTEEQNTWSCFLVYAVISYVLSLCRSKGFMFDLGSTNRYLEHNDGLYFVVGLMGD